MNYGVHNNMALINANGRLKVNTGNRAKSSEKLSTGYRINRSADDAAGLAISEKMRSQIRALDRGTLNGQEGVSWVQTGDGALEEVHALLQRMRELTIQSLNDTNTEEDRAACQAEFDALQSEIDRITGTTQFNTQNIFDEHELPYYQCEGNAVWPQYKQHVIGSNNNDLTIKYRETATGVVNEVSFTVPAGTYTTQELIDEMDDAIIANGLDEKGIMFEYTEAGTCNLNLEGGEMIDAVGGGLSYLLYEMYTGGGFGALVGTTIFTNEYVTLEISNQNDTLSFDIESFDGSKEHVDIQIPPGYYTKQQLIDYLNNALTGTDVTATEYGTGIKLAGKNSIVTGFKGNMFKIDDTGKVYHSVFYDNVKYGSVKMEPASFVGGAVKPTTAVSEEFANYEIDASNNQLTFQPNGAASATTLTIPDGSYSPADMVDILNQFFNTNQLELNAELYPSSGDYVGIKITSLVEGITSEIGLDTTSSAYDTLFRIREYNNITPKATVYQETQKNTSATVTGAKELSDSNVPLTITAGVNDSFLMTVKDESSGTAVETTYTITVDAKSYSSATELMDNINLKLDAALGADAGRVRATLDGSKIRLYSIAGNGITSVKVAAATNADSSTNEGYNDIFVKREVTYISSSVGGTGTSTTPPSVTLTDVDLAGTSFTSSNNSLDITVNGETHTVTFPTGNLTQDEIENAIETQIPETEEMVDNKFTSVSDSGSIDSNNFDVSDSGATNVYTRSYSDTGSSDEVEGKPGIYTNNEAASITTDYAVPSYMEITDDCNKIQLKFLTTGTASTITLTNGVYTQAALVKEIQKQIDTTFGTGYGSGTVSLNSSGKLVITARLNQGNAGDGPGAGTCVECGTSTSSFLKKLHTVEDAATVKKSEKLQTSIKIDSTCNTMSFTYKDETGTHNVSLTLSDGTYNQAGIVAEINKQLAAGGHEVTATLDNGGLRLTTNDVGNDTYIRYAYASGGTSVNALYGEETTTPATVTVALDTLDAIKIDDSSNQFKISVNGTSHTLTLDNKDSYTRDEFVTMLNQKFADAGIGLTAELDGNRLKYTTTAEGSSAKVSISYDASANSAMRAIYGQEKIIHPGVDAEFDANGDLVLTSTQNGGSISVKPTADSPILPPEEKVTLYQPYAAAGYTSKNHSYIQGVAFASGTTTVTIDEWNNDLQFTYYDGSNKTINIDIPEKEYTFAELQSYLQSQLDDATTGVGAGELTVTVTEKGVRIETVATGADEYMVRNSFSGGFYNKVLCKATHSTSTQKVTNKNGTQDDTLAYTIGRKDIRDAETLIRAGINDVLSLDFTYPNQTVKLSMKLDAGTYGSGDLVKALQEKLDEQLDAIGLEPGTIEVGIGGVNSGVSGSNDNNALVFKLSTSVKLPADGTYIIDGVSGNAAFSIFYQTEGELEPAYISGSKDITEGVTIKPGETDLSFVVDGTDSYTISLPEKDYTAQELIDEMNAQLGASGAPVIAEAYGNTVRLVYATMGEHRISDVSGSAKEEVFFQENGETGDRTGVMIQLSNNKGNALEIDRPIVNTSYLGINSVAITRPKYANKALVRLDGAIDRVSEIRSHYGSMQNRLEHSIMNNENTSENTQAAESRIRDTDMAEEMVSQAKYNILQQVTESMMAQAKVSAEGILRLLQI